ncbi:MAG: hypothetical protein JWM95_1838 [Gemmatimonadetes bacterium]|nr:hypothetical protein [Gemmatimonadota bacterium]
MGIASYVGIDPDPEAIRFCEAMDPSGRGTYLQGFGEDLTRVPDRSCSFVMARVSVPYMDIGAFVREAHRVLEPGGQLWISYHTPRHVVHHLGQSLRARHVKDIVFRSYVLVNGAAFHLFGRQFRFPYNGRIESFQTRRALRRALVGAGFGDVEFQYDSRRDLASAMARRAR